MRAVLAHLRARRRYSGHYTELFSLTELFSCSTRSVSRGRMLTLRGCGTGIQTLCSITGGMEPRLLRGEESDAEGMAPVLRRGYGARKGRHQ